jgi:hypothetical protein
MNQNRRSSICPKRPTFGTVLAVLFQLTDTGRSKNHTVLFAWYALHQLGTEFTEERLLAQHRVMLAPSQRDLC